MCLFGKTVKPEPSLGVRLGSGFYYSQHRQQHPLTQIAENTEKGGELNDREYGKVGTPDRDQYEATVAEAVHSYKIGEAIRKARLQQDLTQEELGKRLSVGRARISKLEKGYSMTIPTMSRVFKALGIATATFDLGTNVGKVSLW